MAGFVLNTELHAIARYLIKLEHFVSQEYKGVVNINSEIQQLNEQYGFVTSAQFPAFHADVYGMYQFESKRSLDSINQTAYAKFRLDNLTGNNRIQHIKADLASELQAVRT